MRGSEGQPPVTGTGITLTPAELDALLKSARTPMLATTHTPLGPHPLWHRKHPVEHLPDYIENIAKALERSGHSESDSIRMAVAAVKRWAKGKGAWGHKGKPTPVVQAAAKRAVAQWEKLKAEKQ